MDDRRRPGALRIALIGAALLVLAACGSSGGGGGTPGQSEVGTAIHAGTPTAHKHKHKHKHGASAAASSSASRAGHGSSGGSAGRGGGGSAGGGGGGGTGGGGTGGGGGGGTGGGGGGGGGGGHPTSSHPTSRTSSVPPPGSGPTATVTPHDGLHDGQAVHVVAAGFAPNEKLIVVECLNKGEATGPNDCALGHSKYVTSTAQGTVDATINVYKKVGFLPVKTCSQPTQCLVAVSQPNQTSHSDEADVHLTFA